LCYILPNVSFIDLGAPVHLCELRGLPAQAGKLLPDLAVYLAKTHDWHDESTVWSPVSANSPQCKSSFH
jgi:hypothetical protein